MIEYNQRSRGGLALIFQLAGSVYPRVAPFAFLSCAICLTLKAITYWSDFEHFNHIFKHPYVYQIYTFVLGFILVFRCNLAYQRFWEGRTNIQLMSSKWADAILQAIVFDSFSKKSKKEIHMWRARVISMMSLLHGVALAELGGQHHTMDVIKGVDPRCLKILKDPTIKDKVFLVLIWVQDTLIKRMQKEKGLDVPPPISTRIFQELSNGMLGYKMAYKIYDTPFPFPYVQILTVQLLLLTITSGFVVNVFVDSPIWAVMFSCVAVGGYCAINEVAKELEDPFGVDANDLPMQNYQHEFNCRLMCCASLNMGKFRLPEMDPTTQQLYDMQTDDTWDKIEDTEPLAVPPIPGPIQTSTIPGLAEVMDPKHEMDMVGLRWIKAREVTELKFYKEARERGDLTMSRSKRAMSEEEMPETQ